MCTRFFVACFTFALLAGCAEQSIKPAEVFDERSGVTVGALQQPLEFVPNAESVASASAKRISFAYMGPIEWDRMGDISYALWIHVAPGSDVAVRDIHASESITVSLDDGVVTLQPASEPQGGHGPYKAVASWGQTGYFDLDVALLRRLAASRTFVLHVRTGEAAAIDFLPSQDTHATLTQFMRSRGITDD